MSQIEPNREWLLRYVLGELSEDETRQADERFFADDAFAGMVDETYRDALDAYAAGEIKGSDKERVERAFFGEPHQAGRLQNSPGDAVDSGTNFESCSSRGWAYRSPATLARFVLAGGGIGGGVECGDRGGDLSTQRENTGTRESKRGDQRSSSQGRTRTGGGNLCDSCAWPKSYTPYYCYPT